MMTDDEINDRIADEIVARIGARPLSRRFMRQLVALHTRQALGLVDPPSEISDAALGTYIGLAPQRISELRRLALRTLREKHGADLQHFL